jgi:hypothetical protein
VSCNITLPQHDLSTDTAFPGKEKRTVNAKDALCLLIILEDEFS